MAHVQILHDDLTNPALALTYHGLSVQYVEVPVEGLDPQSVVQVSGPRGPLEQFLTEYDLTDYRIVE